MGFFITFEGIEGCGKTTQLRLLKERLEAAGEKVTVTREPGGCPVADQMRAILLDAKNSAITPLAELLLYAAARAQHVQEVIVPALERGETVLCDRFTDATVAYQGHGRGLDLTVIEELNTLATGRVQPALTVLIDCPVEVGLSRALARIEATSGAKEERFERESLLFHQKVRNGYLTLAAAFPERFVVVDGSGDVRQTGLLVAEALRQRMQSLGKAGLAAVKAGC
ncbi:thymidylate kinase [Citrifermentans bemidjiense Bem]|uniref:Thymidylate kinase n=1 Tax=Citrifermentans bemidjiense (strain ATCC BAA-1014 / DSM 16622 / JCM 12645 / Bem) TaxID=404380 RepID=KTHY_CITBB|nr:dTMP kinase [Citrifermentans bemidjiense]B5E9M9.1 RecName: Full=Thymidylate kinase; AltName: Full=dTMP kinase [Citrifermentans bemidjiense Bem]ACH40203.1 thymidylate kinase [Citrifermentans bemidjiense Bem]